MYDSISKIDFTSIETQKNTIIDISILGVSVRYFLRTETFVFLTDLSWP